MERITPNADTTATERIEGSSYAMRNTVFIPSEIHRCLPVPLSRLKA